MFACKKGYTNTFWFDIFHSQIKINGHCTYICTDKHLSWLLILDHMEFEAAQMEAAELEPAEIKQVQNGEARDNSGQEQLTMPVAW